MRLAAVAWLPLLAGCLSSASLKTPANWLLASDSAEFAVASKPELGEARLAVVAVRAPYDGRSLAVLRPDGSIAFDPYNQFAAVPSALAKGAALDVLRRTGRFVGVQPAVTTADVRTTLEVVVDELALDCRAEGERQASVRLTLVLIRDRQVVSARTGEARADASAGDYSAAFGTAFAKALAGAAARLNVR